MGCVSQAFAPDISRNGGGAITKVLSDARQILDTRLSV
jgi:hypothetical protein